MSLPGALKIEGASFNFLSTAPRQLRPSYSNMPNTSDRSHNCFPRRLFAFDRRNLLQHFNALTTADRHLRFGASLSDAAIRAYVLGIDFGKDALFGAFDDDLILVGMAHVARGGDYAELGLSVLRPYRNRGVGRSLLKRAHVHARTWGIRTLHMHCLAVNVAVVRLAREEGMEIAAESGDADAWVQIPPPDLSTYVADGAADVVSSFAHALQLHRMVWRGLIVSSRPSEASALGSGATPMPER